MALERDKHTAQHALLTLHESQLLDLYRRMTLIRRFEEKTAEMYSRGKITGFCHLYAGEEAVAVGAIYALYDKDYVVSTYREHGHCLAKGAEPRVVMAELFGKATGISHGRGGSMHLFDQDLRFMGGYAIVGGGLPIACGLALAVSYNEGPEVVCCFFGDGALPQGAFHETLNMASLWKLPLVFICENNFYGMGTLVQNAISQEELYRFAEPYKMPGVRVDGMDVLEVYRRHDGGGCARARRRRTVVDRGRHLSLPRPFDVRSGRVSLEARGTNLAGARPDQESAPAPARRKARHRRQARRGRARGQPRLSMTRSSSPTKAPSPRWTNSARAFTRRENK